MEARLPSIITGLGLSAFLMASAGQFGRISFGDVSFYLFEPIVLLAVGALVIRYGTLPWHRLRTAGLAHSISCLFIWLFLTFFLPARAFSFGENVIAALYLFRLFVYLVFILYWTVHCLESLSDGRWYGRITMGAIMLTFLSGAFQYVFFPDLRALTAEGWDPHYARVFGTFLEPVVYASLSGLMLIGLFLYPAGRGVIWLARVAGGVLFLATFSRGAWISMLTALPVLIPKNISRTVLLVGGAMVILAFFLLPKPSGEGVNVLRTSTIASRAADAGQGLTLWRARPITGIGYNRVSAVKQTESSPESTRNRARSQFHTVYITMGATAGIIGVLLFLNFLAALAGIHRFSLAAVLFTGTLSLFDAILTHPIPLLGIAAGTGYFAIFLSRK